jgi:hypothetical protein
MAFDYQIERIVQPQNHFYIVVECHIIGLEAQWSFFNQNPNNKNVLITGKNYYRTFCGEQLLPFCNKLKCLSVSVTTKLV